jgi:hypothetical protein
MEDEIAAEFAAAAGDDETHEMHSVALEEQAAKEMEEFLETLEKENLAETIKLSLQKKLEAATTKLAGLFEKQRELSMEEEVDQLELMKIATLANATSGAEVEKSNANRKQDNMKQIMLQKKINALDNKLELAEQKAHSLTMQWYVFCST